LNGRRLPQCPRTPARPKTAQPEAVQPEEPVRSRPFRKSPSGKKLRLWNRLWFRVRHLSRSEVPYGEAGASGGSGPAWIALPSDLTDAEWALVAALIRPAKRGGRPRSVNVREGLNAIVSRALDGVPVDGVAERPAPAQHGLGVSGPVGLGRNPRAHSSRALRRGPGGGRPGGQPNDGDY
jgi:hypothetical protein